MGGFEIAAIAIMGHMEEFKHERWLATLPADIAAEIRKKEEAARIEVKKDHQHEELCEALHASGKTKIVERYSSSFVGNSSNYGQGLATGLILMEILK